MCLPESAAV
jgi:hypothetical protein